LTPPDRSLRRAEDGALILLVELALILVYICALLIKSCSLSTVVCASLGFGDSARGVYLFFIFFGIAMLALQFFVCAIKLWSAGYVPRIVLLARSHSMSPLTILRKLSARW
jgi:hypothetical protein